MRLRLRLLLILVLASPVAQADPLDRWERKQERRERLEQRLMQNPPQAGRLSPGEAARLAQHRNGGGRVLDVVPAGDGWQVKLIKSGEVRTVYVTGDR